MRIAALYDIHGNLPAVEAVLADLDRLDVDRIVVGGDVYPGPWTREVLAALQRQSRPCHFLRGNGENDVLAVRAGREILRVPAFYRPAMAWHAADLTGAEAAELERWSVAVRLESPELGTVLFCHATPRDDNELFTRVTPAERLAPIFAACGAALVVCGHTHMPFDRTMDSVRVVNAGSVGMPFGRRGADWLLLGSAVELRHTDYDVEAAAALLRSSAFPQAEFSAKAILQPPDVDEMTALYERAALR